ncbi:conserved hypothetical protein [Beggiatoa sp. PS]|nr:conserved hypothetical protein [Beggiatoa sp. PS]
MALFLQILGILFLIILFVVGIYVFIFVRATRRVKKLSQLDSFYGGLHGFKAPARIKLIRLSEPEWTNPEQIEPIINEMMAQGFKSVGTYMVPNTHSSVQYQFLLHPIHGGTQASFVSQEDGLTVILHEHPKFGIWSEAFWKYTSGKTLTVSNAQYGECFNVHPNHPKYFLKDASIFELIDEIRKKRSVEPYEPVTPENFPILIESLYAEEMDWRNLQGYLTDEELQRFVTSADIELDQSDLDIVRSLVIDSASEGLSEACQDSFIKTTSMPVAEWEAIRDHLVVIHDRMSGEDAASFLDSTPGLGEHLEDDIEALEELESATTSIRQAFAEINQKLPKNLQFKPLGQVEKPISADIYLTTEEIL